MRTSSFGITREGGGRRRRERAVSIKRTDEEEERSWEAKECEGVARG